MVDIVKFNVIIFLILCCRNDFVSTENCDWQKIGEYGARFILDQAPVAGGTLNRILDNFWPDDCAFKQIQAYINSKINEDRQRTMRDKFNSFKSTLERARFMGWNLDSKNMVAFYIVLHSEKDLFMKNNLEDAVIYFR